MLVYLGMGIGIFFSEQMKGKDGWMALGVGSGVQQTFLSLVHRSKHSGDGHSPLMAIK